MRIEGKLKKNGRWWEVEIPALRIATQGTSRADALDMALDAIRLHAEDLGVVIPLEIDPGEGGLFYVVSSDIPGLLAFILKRQRQRSGMTAREAARNLGINSPSAYARYETGRTEPGFSKVSALIGAINPDASLVVTTVIRPAIVRRKGKPRKARA